ncbi:MAG: zinc ribbon domain-containing protein [Thermoplasmata archaeon]|nr:zinc ribbon domain-containing protein [Thermoplasmata archaeon]
MTTLLLASSVMIGWFISLYFADRMISANVRKRQRRIVSQTVRRRPISIISKVEGAKKCSICMGLIKKDLTSIECGCGSSFHISCGSRVGICPICRKEIELIKMGDQAVEFEEFRPVRTMPLSREDRLFLLEDRLLLGEIDQEMYVRLKSEIEESLPEPLICASCGTKLYPGERCKCSERSTINCPECRRELEAQDEFCKSCGLVLSENFTEELFQCSSCGRIVTSKERICSCGAILLDPGDSICPECGHPVSPSDKVCPKCGRIRIIELLACPDCGCELSPADFECDCGAIFADMIDRIECPECSAEVGLEDKFCKGCGVEFQRNRYSSVNRL